MAALTAKQLIHELMSLQALQDSNVFLEADLKGMSPMDLFTVFGYLESMSVPNFKWEFKSHHTIVCRIIKEEDMTPDKILEKLTREILDKPSITVEEELDQCIELLELKHRLFGEDGCLSKDDKVTAGERVVYYGPAPSRG